MIDPRSECVLKNNYYISSIQLTRAWAIGLSTLEVIEGLFPPPVAVSEAQLTTPAIELPSS